MTIHPPFIFELSSELIRVIPFACLKKCIIRPTFYTFSASTTSGVTLMFYIF
nr:MAG TPA: hypothetical protein [Caudoviricetes sp.]